MKVRSFVILGVVTYLLVLLVNTPASFILDAIWPAQGKGIPKLVHSQGTLWKGDVRLDANPVGPVDVSWDLSPMALLVGSAAGDVKVSGQGLNFSGYLSGSMSDLQIENGQAFVSSATANRFLRAQRVSLEGDIEINDLNLNINHVEKMVREAQGRLVWHGGKVSYPERGKPKSVTMPMVIAQLGSEENNLVAQLAEAGGNTLGRVTVKSDGWAGAAINRRLLDLAKVPYRGKESPDEVVFELSEKVF